MDRRQLQEIIANLSEGVILIEPGGRIVWANDAALRMHGVDRRVGLGATVAEYRRRFVLVFRNHHRLRRAQYPAERLRAGETFRDLVATLAVGRTGADGADGRAQGRDADGDTDVRVLGFCGQIIGDDAGRPESLVLVVQDLTERHLAEERFERTFAANPAPAVICRLSDLRFIKVNGGFLQMTGHTRDGVLGRSVYEIDVFGQSPRRDEAVAGLNEGRTIPQIEAMLRLPDGSHKFVIVAGQPIEVMGEASMLLTFIDLESRRQAENELRNVQERFSKAFRLAPVPMVVAALDGLRPLEVNDAFVQTTGYPPEAVIGRPGATLPLWADARAFQQFERRLRVDGSVRHAELPLLCQDQARLDGLACAETVSILGEACVLIVLQDVTERKRGECELMAAIEAVMKDASWFSRTVIEKLAQIRGARDEGADGIRLADLTRRETEVLALICAGQSDAAIARVLGVARNTVRNHVAALYTKIGVNRRGAAIIWGRERGLGSMAGSMAGSAAAASPKVR